MLTRKHSIEGKQPFGDAAGVFDMLDAEAALKLAMVAGDISLLLDEQGRILDATANPREFPEFADWIGRDWMETVTIESRGKVMEMLAGARKGETQHWRQVNHRTVDGDVPVRYVLISVGEGGRSIAFGRDMREAAAMQQRILQAQQSLERDYMRLRQVETRYRLLFEMSSQPVLIVEGDSFRVREANPAAHEILGVKPGSLPGGKVTALVPRAERDRLISFLGSAGAARSVAPVSMVLGKREEEFNLSASAFRQDGGQFIFVRLESLHQGAPANLSATIDIVESMPDAFVMTDSDMVVEAANLAFVELVKAASEDQLRGRPLGQLVGRPGIDLELIGAQLAKHGFARNVGTVVGIQEGEDPEPVELSAVRTEGDDPHYGFVIRPIGRRLRDLPPTSQDMPRSVEQLTELVGRMSLKEIVRESTDLIERLCIEAALAYTSDNRASAAEILGLSRQSLYSKLHRYGLGNLEAEPD
ncbi:transcriptional regulator PpsR [Aurantiacibacter poecillastricola]|uniref:transcriptional regulator PpsR n=1 Tax=Aurantiacibacter poecillastricola TaxID=3064385 RepID=UPI00273FA314|nr:transcriptional regulator PpsR [Aurantiacibacter sp. 219JJ12-13]MDP5260390.1 transcriptional regulator PpsR [Aurantiacibacter sp. 219JJ12-13]